MVRVVRAFLFALVVFFFAACNYLSESPRQELPESEVITSASQLYASTVLMLHTQFGGSQDGIGLQGTYRGVYDLQTFTTDEAMIPTRGGDWYDGGVWQDLYLHTYTAHNEIVLNAWNYLFQVITLCNRSLALLDQYQSLITTDEAKQYRAEVRAIRAIYYMYLLDLYGNVPILTDASVSVNDIEQAQREDVFWFCVKELQQTEPYLLYGKSAQDGECYGHVTRSVAQFALMKLALNAEVWTDKAGTEVQFDYENEKCNAWQTVCYYGESIQYEGYHLDEWYSTPFGITNSQSNENIFTIPVDKDKYLNRQCNQFRSLHYQHGSALGYGGENGSCATLETLQAFGYKTDNEDTRFWANFFADTVFVGGVPLQLSNGDTLVYQADKVELDLTGSPYQATAGARMYKYEIDPAGRADGKLRRNDIVLFRYADVLLMMAEAKVRNGESGQAELDEVRARALMPQVEATLDNIYKERRVELMWEGWHRQDMIRFQKFTLAYSDREQLHGEHATGGYTTIFPIPQRALDMNKNLKQNKGYE